MRSAPLRALLGCGLVACSLSELSSPRTDAGTSVDADLDGGTDDSGLIEASVDSPLMESSTDSNTVGFCDAQRAGPNASLIRLCRDFDDGDIGEFFGSTSKLRSIDSATAVSGKNSVLFSRPNGSSGSYSDIFLKALFAGTPQMLDFSAAVHFKGTSEGGFSIRTLYGNEGIALNMFGSNGDLEANPGYKVSTSGTAFANQWGTLRITVDFIRKKFQVFINGIDASAGEQTLPATPGPLSLYVELFGNDPNATLRLDNVLFLANDERHPQPTSVVFLAAKCTARPYVAFVCGRRGPT